MTERDPPAATRGTGGASPDLAAAADAAASEAVARLLAAEPVLVDVCPARQVIGALSQGVLLHSGPPLEWDQMPDCTRGAVVGTMLHEGWADSATQARERAAAGGVRFLAGHPRGCVAPVAGIVGPSTPVLVVADRANGTRAYAPLVEGRGRVVRYGAYDGEALGRLGWFDRVLAPALAEALRSLGGVALAPPMNAALHMGDELHNRTKAFTRELLLALTADMLRRGGATDELAGAVEFIGRTDIFFLSASMAAAKSALLAIEGIPWCPLVSIMTQNGHEFAIQVAGLGDRWFSAPAPAVRGRYFEGWSATEACPAIGDSIITETFGFGAFALAAAPALTRYIGGSVSEAVGLNESMYAIAAAENPRYTLPALEFRGVPTGIDVRKVVVTGTAPVTNAGIAHREAGVGQIGAGYIDTPPVVFARAWRALEAAWPAHAQERSNART